ncbi:MAG: cytochrome c [Alphaproteobacteria bacterium]|nr:cytochrome c [Alphaproteobacteria bacterium]
MVTKKLILGAIAVAALASTAWVVDVAAQSNVLQDRLQNMRAMGGSFRPIAAVVQGQSQDLDAAATAARTMADQAKRITTLYPAGSGRDGNPESRARPEIWSNRAEFERLAGNLATAAEALATAAASKNVDAIRTAMGPTQQACGGCHGGPPASGGPFRFERPQ